MKASWKPWHEVVQLRDDLKTGELSLAVFAADLYDVVMQKGRRPVYENPAEFFALTYPTYNLRELVRNVVLRLAGQSDRAYHKLSVNYGGGKTHTHCRRRRIPLCRPWPACGHGIRKIEREKRISECRSRHFAIHRAGACVVDQRAGLDPR